MSESDFMRQAIELAYRGIGYTKQNPLVGCVIVKDGEIIGAGWHHSFGEAHAEVNAVNDAQSRGESVAGADVFVTLEPCFHQGKTPPCVDLLIQKKVRSVAILFQDENELVRGKSVQKLRQNGIWVNEDFSELQKENEDLYADFFSHIRTKKTYVVLKMALDANGFMGPGPQRITGEEAQHHTHFLRQRYDAILVGANTVCTDDPHLGVRFGEYFQGPRDPLRIIFDPHLRVPKTARVFRDENFLLVTVAQNKAVAQTQFGERAMSISLLSNGEFDLTEFLQKMYKRGIASILVEGGAKTIRTFLDQREANYGFLYLSPHSVFSSGIPGIDFRTLPEFSTKKTEKLGTDTLIQGNIAFL